MNRRTSPTPSPSQRITSVPTPRPGTSPSKTNCGHGIVSEVSYLGTKGTHLNVETLPNEGPAAQPYLEPAHQLGNAVGFILNSSDGNSIYNALQVRIQQRFRRGVSWQLNYIFSKSIDDSSTFGGVGNTVAQNWLDLGAERGLSSFDRRHVLTGSWTLTSPIGGARLPLRLRQPHRRAFSKTGS